MPSRIIKESICVSRKLNSLTPEEEVFFYRLLVNCDDYGCFYGDPLVLAGKMYPRRPCTAKQVRAWRDRVAQVGLIAVYRIDGEEYIEVQAWHEHQRQRTMRRKYPKRDPLTDDGHLTADCGQAPADCGQMTDTCPQNAASPESNPIHTESIPNPYKELPSGSVLYREAMDAFREMRKASKKRLTPKAEEMIRTKLEQLAPGNESKQVAILNQSTMNGWLGVFPLNEDKAATGRKSTNPAGNFTQREYSDKYLDSMYDEVPRLSPEELAAATGQADEIPPPEED